MATQRACKQCKRIFEGSKCPGCGSDSYSESFKGKIALVNPEQSELAGKIRIAQKGVYALKL